MIDAFGWSWEYIDEEMTLPRYYAILKQWRINPPLSISVAAIARGLGVLKEPQLERSEDDKQGDVQQLGSYLGGAGFKAEKPAWLIEAEAATPK